LPWLNESCFIECSENAMVEGLRSRRYWVAGGLLLLVLMGLGAGLSWPDSQPFLVLKPRELVHSVVASATVQTQHRANVGVQIAGKVQTVQVTEGERFQVGQVLLQLDNSEAHASWAAAELAVRQAEFKLRQWREVQAPTARASEQLANANLAQSRGQLARQQDLFRQGFMAQAALDEATRSVEVMQAQARTAQAQRQANDDHGLEQQLAQSTLLLARTQAQTAWARLTYTTLRAPFDGHVISRNAEPGDTVQPGKTLLMLAPMGATELVAQIDERNLSFLRVGQSATASADAFAQAHFAAEVSDIAPGVDAQRGSVQVKLRVRSPPDYLRQDMTVSVEIEVDRQAAALAVPLQAVHETQTDHPWVWRINATSHLEREPVTLGLRSGAWVQLNSGVTAGDRLLDSAGTGLHDGQRVRPIQP
jgi:HlyD family secretion protein